MRGPPEGLQTAALNASNDLFLRQVISGGFRAVEPASASGFE